MAAGAPRAICLDVTRIVSRVGAGPLTGIDRVEYAYLRELCSREVGLFCFARAATGFALLDKGGALGLKERIDGVKAWGPIDLPALLSFRISPARRAAESDLRRLARATAIRGGAKQLLGKHLPEGTLYLNTGHSNLSRDVLSAASMVPGGRVVVLVHDTIPLRLPETQRPHASLRFRERLSAVSAYAHGVVCISESERVHVEAEIRKLGGSPRITVALPGVEVTEPDLGSGDADSTPGTPYFVTVGTIEPRKNHAFLLDLWDHLAASHEGEVPRLCIVGRRGWGPEAVFRRLDRYKSAGGPIEEFGDLSDGACAALVAGSSGLLFPTLAEGFGFPPLEALAHGVPAVCTPLPVFRETMGDLPVYAETADLYQWADIVRGLATGQRSGHLEQGTQAKRLHLPTWHAHLNQVLGEFG